MGGFIGSLTGANQAKAAKEAARIQAEAEKAAADRISAAYGQSSPILAGAYTDSAKALQDAYGQGSAAQVSGLNQANDTLNQGFGSALGFYRPYNDLGNQAAGQLSAGLDDGSLTRRFSMSDFQSDPSYDYLKQQGMSGIQQSAAAGGGLMSGATLKALQTNNQNLANQNYQQSYNNFNNDQQSRYARLFGLSQAGQSAAGNMSNLTYQNAGNIAGNQIGIGNAQNAGLLGGAGAYGQGLLGAANATSQGILGAAGAQAQGLTGAANANAAGVIGKANAYGTGASNLLNLGLQLGGSALSAATGMPMNVPTYGQSPSAGGLNIGTPDLSSMVGGSVSKLAPITL